MLKTMKLTLIGKLVAVTAFAWTGMIPWFPSQASPFDEQEVNQDDFIAIARPYGENKYDLLILRQIPGQRQCWQEQESNSVTTIDPLLLNFNFAGSCQRSTDSNGYSIRIDGEDFGLDYLLRVVKRKNELLLVGSHRSDSTQPDIIIGRTEGISSGFLKIDLDPGWRFTQRAYNGKVLSHVYITGDSAAILAQPSIEDELISESEKEQTFTAQTQPSPVSSDNAVSSQSPSLSNEPPPLPNFSELPPLEPPTTKSVNGLVPPPPPKAVNTGRSGVGAVSGSTATSNKNPKGYRVVVAVNSSQDQTRVRSLFPKAFSTSYQGRSMLQVGLFSDKDNAQKAEQSLKNIGLKPIIIQ